MQSRAGSEKTGQSKKRKPEDDLESLAAKRQKPSNLEDEPETESELIIKVSELSLIKGVGVFGDGVRFPPYLFYYPTLVNWQESYYDSETGLLLLVPNKESEIKIPVCVEFSLGFFRNNALSAQLLILPSKWILDILIENNSQAYPLLFAHKHKNKYAAYYHLAYWIREKKIISKLTTLEKVRGIFISVGSASDLSNEKKEEIKVQIEWLQKQVRVGKKLELFQKEARKKLDLLQQEEIQLEQLGPQKKLAAQMQIKEQKKQLVEQQIQLLAQQRQLEMEKQEQLAEQQKKAERKELFEIGRQRWEVEKEQRQLTVHKRCQQKNGKKQQKEGKALEDVIRITQSELSELISKIEGLKKETNNFRKGSLVKTEDFFSCTELVDWEQSCYHPGNGLLLLFPKKTFGLSAGTCIAYLKNRYGSNRHGLIRKLISRPRNPSKIFSFYVPICLMRKPNNIVDAYFFLAHYFVTGKIDNRFFSMPENKEAEKTEESAFSAIHVPSPIDQQPAPASSSFLLPQHSLFQQPPEPSPLPFWSTQPQATQQIAYTNPRPLTATTSSAPAANQAMPVQPAIDPVNQNSLAGSNHRVTNEFLFGEERLNIQDKNEISDAFNFLSEMDNDFQFQW